MTYADALKRFRKDFNLTQKQTASAAGILQQAYQKYEYGRSPSADVIVALADYFNVSADYLLGRTDNPSPPAK